MLDTLTPASGDNDALLAPLYQAFDFEPLAAQAGRPHEPMRTWLPYLFQRLENGRFIALNRYYKPCGVMGSAPHVRYELWPIQYEMVVNDETVGWLDDWSPTHFHLYHDGDSPYASKQDYSSYTTRLNKALLRTGACIIGMHPRSLA